MKHGKPDQQHRMLITGLALKELKRHACDLPESFGLDRKIERYQGKRPLTLYRWDLECLLDTLDMVVKEPRGYPCDNSLERGKRFREWFVPHDDPRCVAIRCLFDELRGEYCRAYGGGDCWWRGDAPEEQDNRKLGQ